MVGPPELRYAMNGAWRLAYQVLGDGPDLLYLPGWVSNVEGNWLLSDHARFLEGLASLARTIVVDRRGNGCSDRLPPGESSTLEESVEDLRHVLRAAQTSQAAVFGVQDGGFFALLAAATHPERFTRLILFGAAPTWKRTEETPWQWADDRWEDTDAAFSGPGLTDAAAGYIRYALPSYAGDPLAVRRMAMLLALTVSPSSGLAETDMLRQIDLRDLLPTIAVPTLVLHRTEDPVEPIESGRYLAEHIPGATLVELSGRRHASLGGGLRGGAGGDPAVPRGWGCGGGKGALAAIARHGAVHGRRRVHGARGEARRRRISDRSSSAIIGRSARSYVGTAASRSTRRVTGSSLRSTDRRERSRARSRSARPSVPWGSRSAPASTPARSRRSTARWVASACTSVRE